MKKLSEYNTKDGMRVVARLAPHIADITGDEDFLLFVNNIVETKDVKNKIIASINRIAEIIPIIFDKHADSVIEIVAIMSDKTVDEIGNQKLIVTIADFKSLFEDKDFVELFR